MERKPMLVVASKIDAANQEKLTKLKRYCTRKKLELFPISAVTGGGVDALRWAMARKIQELRAAETQPEATIQPAPAE